ncbi:PREDICTED: interleukin-1 receptor-associated kinase-like 2 [Gekko japonicus]|uniref:Interleukin-1 receptor-associated kinase-like 2 n=1 Tax=Gekko japonicus TaxID=146911 RepID=A0ABM1L426_GEKJA|nr:PREDICTED: interleukin-1 receptor-associated kinase-like 2 [Gekko japonicus]
MALQPRPSPACPRSEGARQSPYVYNIPSDVLGKFCEQMDCLNNYDWMRFASNVITDQTELRKIKCLEKTGISITRELMWWWGVRLATVQQLLELLSELQFYRAAKTIADWMSLPLSADSLRTPLDSPQQQNTSLHPHGNRHEDIRNGTKISLPSNSAHSDPVLKADPDCPPLSLPPASIDLPHSLHSNPPASSSVKVCSSSTPQQESLQNLPSRSLVWTKDEVETATNGFSEENRINESMFADAYRGQRQNALYVVKRLKEKECANQNQTQRFFHTEVQICFRCCHHNILNLLGFTIESELHCLIYPYMHNGSLTDRLQCQGGSEPLTWEKRIRIAIGLIQAIQYLHNFGILHGNVKSSNVLLDANFVPKLGHSGHRLQPVEKKTENGGTKTKVMQASLAYFLEDFIRHGQLTEKVDIFSCGIVLAEILTGIKAIDERRHPIFLKDALLDEIQVAKELSCSKKGTFENLAAKEICRKYQDRKALHWPATSAICLATAACVCLRKKNPDMAEVNAFMEMADHQLQYRKMSEGREYPGLSLNIPEETNDEPASPFNDGFSDDNYDGSMNAESLNCVDLLPPLIRVMSPETYSEQRLRVPCESDESSNFSWDPMGDVAYQPPTNGLPGPENVSPIMLHANDPEYDDDVTAKSVVSEKHIPPQEAAVSSEGTFLNIENSGATCSSQASAKETIREIKINNQKKKMIQDILLYKEKKLNTCELLNLN